MRNENKKRERKGTKGEKKDEIAREEKKIMRSYLQPKAKLFFYRTIEKMAEKLFVV